MIEVVVVLEFVVEDVVGLEVVALLRRLEAGPRSPAGRPTRAVPRGQA